MTEAEPELSIAQRLVAHAKEVQKGQPAPLSDIMAGLLNDHTIIDWTRVDDTRREAYDQKVSDQRVQQELKEHRTHLANMRLRLAESGVGRMFFDYTIYPTWFPPAALAYPARVIHCWEQRKAEGHGSTTLLPNIVATGLKWTGKSSFAVWACQQIYTACYSNEGLFERRGISIKWTTGGALGDSIRKRESLKPQKQCELLVIDDVFPISPDWARREFESMLMSRYYQGQATILLSRHEALYAGPDNEVPLVTLLPEALEHLMDRRRGFGEVKFGDDLEKRSRVPVDERVGDNWWS